MSRAWNASVSGARDHTELEAWKLADEVRTLVYRLCESPRMRPHLRLVDQLTDAADSGCSNIAEGFHRFYPKEFMRFLRIANGSLSEVIDRLRGAVKRGFADAAEADKITRLARRSIGASVRLIQYLDGCDGPPR